ncbi:MAG: ATP cone domain-containing protein [Planctomycetota bacterium]|nr:ATP cone domain-containing protein [Planctomycetota bacterium]
MRIARIRRRDGAIVPFERRLVEGAVARAAERAGDEGSRAPAEVADLVEMALGRRYGPDRVRAPDVAGGQPNGTASLPGVEEIEDLIEEALIELGHAGVAKAYILDRARDARVRAALGAAGDDAPLGRRAPRVLVNGGLEAWSRARIVAALVSEADVPRALADEVAARVEERVFASGWKRISTSLVRELVDNELVERGLADALRRTRPVGIPRHDLSRWIAAPESEVEPGSAAPRSLEARVAGELLRRYALEDLLPDALEDALADGDFGLEDLDRVHLDLALSAPCDLFVAGEFDAPKAFELLQEVAGLATRSARCVVLEDCGELFQVLSRAPRGSAPDRLGSWLAALTAVSRACGRSIDLTARLKSRDRGPSAPPWFERLVEDLAQAEADGPRAGLPRVHLDATELVEAAASHPALERGVELLLARGRIVPTFGSNGERPVGPGLARGPRERGAIALRAAATLNLPRAARRAGPWREDALFEELHRVLGLALDALAALRDLRRGTSAKGPRARGLHAIVPVGLREAVAWIGDGAARPEAAARLLAFLAEAAERLGSERGLAVALCGSFGERDARRFAGLDARRFQVVQPNLFQTAESTRSEAAYSHGFDLAGILDAGGSRAEDAASVLSALPSGLLDAPGLLRAIARPQDGRAPLCAGLDAFERARARQRARTGVLYALPREHEAASLYSDDAPPTS